jgi:tetratricopeptide (TPR) repeat protein
LPGIHYELGEAILKDSTSDTAIETAEKELQASLAENPGDARAEYRLGRVFAQRLDFKSAIEHYSHALTLQPDYVFAQIGMGEALMKTGEQEKALERLRQHEIVWKHAVLLAAFDDVPRLDINILVREVLGRQ